MSIILSGNNDYELQSSTFSPVQPEPVSRSSPIRKNAEKTKPKLISKICCLSQVNFRNILLVFFVIQSFLSFFSTFILLQSKGSEGVISAYNVKFLDSFTTSCKRVSNFMDTARVFAVKSNTLFQEFIIKDAYFRSKFLNETELPPLELDTLSPYSEMYREEMMWLRYLSMVKTNFTDFGITNYYLGTEEGKFAGISAVRNTISVRYNDTSQSFFHDDFTILGMNGSPNNLGPAFDPKQRPWYTVAKDWKDKTDYVWSPAFFSRSGVLSITASVPLSITKNGTSAMLGVVAIQYELRFFSDVLSQGAKQGTMAFIMNTDSMVIASSTMSNFTKTTDAEQQQYLLSQKANNSGDPLIRYLSTQYNLIAIARTGTCTNSTRFVRLANVPGKGRIGFKAVSWSDAGRNLDWVLVVAEPYVNFLEQVFASDNALYFVASCLIFCIGMVIVICITNFISSPILKISADIRHLSMDTLNKPHMKKCVTYQTDSSQSPVSPVGVQNSAGTVLPQANGRRMSPASLEQNANGTPRSRNPKSLSLIRSEVLKMASPFLEVRQMQKAATAMKQGLNSFKKYIPAELVKKIIQDKKQAELGLENMRITMLVCDLANFTTLSEFYPVDKVIEILTTYIQEVTINVEEHKGLVIRYMGDGIQALWNISYSPIENHELSACYAALESIKNMQLICAEEAWKMAGLPPVNIRVGICTGQALVGNIGSKERFNFTAIGEAAVIAEKLEAYNKTLETQILISEATYLKVRDEFLCEYAGTLDIKLGALNQVDVFELKCLLRDATQTQHDVALMMEEVRRSIRSEKWQDAMIAGSKILRLKKQNQQNSAALLKIMEKCKRKLDKMEKPAASDKIL